MPTPPSSKPSIHICPTCFRSYKAAETLNRHRKNHSPSIAYTCDIPGCNASFKRKDLLDRHTRIHLSGKTSTKLSGSRSRACERCSRLKTRCDGDVGGSGCERCVKGGWECISLQGRRSRVGGDGSPAAVTEDEGASPSSNITSEDSWMDEFLLQDEAMWDADQLMDSPLVDMLDPNQADSVQAFETPSQSEDLKDCWWLNVPSILLGNFPIPSPMPSEKQTR